MWKINIKKIIITHINRLKILKQKYTVLFLKNI